MVSPGMTMPQIGSAPAVRGLDLGQASRRVICRQASRYRHAVTFWSGSC
jgi:hypothetical protein